MIPLNTKKSTPLETARPQALRARSAPLEAPIPDRAVVCEVPPLTGLARARFLTGSTPQRNRHHLAFWLLSCLRNLFGSYRSYKSYKTYKSYWSNMPLARIAGFALLALFTLLATLYTLHPSQAFARDFIVRNATSGTVYFDVQGTTGNVGVGTA